MIALLASDRQPRRSIRRIGVVDSHAERIGRAVALLRRDYMRTIRVEQLAGVAGAGEPAFHQHFREVTTLSPIQFQRQLRVIEARRMMLAHGSRNFAGGACRWISEHIAIYPRVRAIVWRSSPAGNSTGERTSLIGL